MQAESRLDENVVYEYLMLFFLCILLIVENLTFISEKVYCKCLQKKTIVFHIELVTMTLFKKQYFLLKVHAGMLFLWNLSCSMWLHFVTLSHFVFTSVFSLKASPISKRKDHVFWICLFYVYGYYFFIYFLFFFQIAVRGCFLGTACGLGVMVSVLCSSSYHVFGWYMVVLTLFHYSEYITTAIGNPATLSLDSYLLNHSVAYGLAAVASWVEFFIERHFLPEMKTLWYLSTFGILVCLWGEIIRKAAMLTAKTNFNHIVQTERQKDHELVTWGAYSMFRHPSYVGWFWWSIGTQLILVNPICTIAYALASWSFFYERIYFEEITLIKFFGEKYLDYQKKVGTGLPFIRGYQYVRRVRQESDWGFE